LSEFLFWPARVVKEASMDSADHEPKQWATAEQIRAAIENLTVEDLGRLRRAVSGFLYGSEFTDPLELVNEAIARALRGAGSDEGRHWSLHISFVQFLIGAARSITNASRVSPAQVRTECLDDLALGDQAPTDAAGEPVSTASVDASYQEDEEAAEKRAQSEKVFDAIDAYFADAEEVLMLVLCLRDGMRPREIQEAAGMTVTQYNSARRRLRRGLTKLGLSGKRP
jgi:DNA-directed RNA polymerase specialized sigma24 family protein